MGDQGDPFVDGLMAVATEPVGPDIFRDGVLSLARDVMVARGCQCPDDVDQCGAPITQEDMRCDRCRADDCKNPDGSRGHPCR